MTKRADTLRRSIAVVTQRLNTKLAVIEWVMASNRSDEIKQMYLDGIEHDKQMLERLHAYLERTDL